MQKYSLQKHKNVISKLTESVTAVLPVSAIVLIAGLSVGVMDALDVASLIVGVVFLIGGMFLYNIGSVVAIEPIGAQIGGKIASTGKLWIVLIVCFFVGVIVTIAEPDLNVLASQIASVPKVLLIAVVGLGVGVFMLLAVLRLALKVPLNILFLVAYAIVFAVAGVVSHFYGEAYVTLGFDSGGVTTGPMTVPFILALCVGVSTVAGGNKSDENSFGMVGICSIGPILAVLILGLVFRSDITATAYTTFEYSSFGEVLLAFLKALPEYLKEVGIAIAPITVFFVLFDLVALKLPKKALARILIGIVYTYIGLALFLTGANVGFMRAGYALGVGLAGVSRWLIVAVGVVVGACIVLAEPAVHVLNKQVETITDGIIKSRTMMIVFSGSIALAVGLAMLRVALNISVWWFIAPGYAVALLLTFFSPKIFSAIAFDSGGVASGPMTATFLIPFAVGAATELGENVLNNAFGTVAMVAMTPLITLQVLGCIYKAKTKQQSQVASRAYQDMLAGEGNVIELMK